MKTMWCWRCRQDVVMLDEDEYKIINDLYRECMKRAEEIRRDKGSSLKEAFEPVSDAYEKITGLKDFHHNTNMHHRISIYGPPCSKCGKPLRTSRVKMCAACGNKVI